CISRSRHVSTPLSRARKQARIASSPIHVPEPSSPSTGPQPPAPTVVPFAQRPVTCDPVPAMTSTPAPPRKAASSAICSSPVMMVLPLTSSARIVCAQRRTSSLEDPASPKQVPATESPVMPADPSASRTIIRSPSVAARSPTFISFTVGPEDCPSTRDSSAIQHSVLVPPPSSATKYDIRSQLPMALTSKSCAKPVIITCNVASRQRTALERVRLPCSIDALASLLATQRLSAFDLTLVAAYLIGITLFGLRFRKSRGAAAADRSLKSYFLADNTIPWWAIALSVVSAETSTLTIISIPGVAFAGDFGFLQVVIGYLLGRVVVAALFLPRYFAGEMLTAYQLIDRRFGPTLHKVTAALFLVTRAAAEGVRVFAVSIVVGIAIG